MILEKLSIEKRLNLGFGVLIFLMVLVAARGRRGRASRSEMGEKRAQFVSDFEDCSPATAGKTGPNWGIFSAHCSRLSSAAQAPSD